MTFFDRDWWRDPEGWRSFAMCKPINDEHPNTRIFFDGTPRTNKDALTVCGECPVQSECLVSTMEFERPYGVNRFGVAGGMTATERKALAKMEESVAEDPVPGVGVGLSEVRERAG